MTLPLAAASNADSGGAAVVVMLLAEVAVLVVVVMAARAMWRERVAWRALRTSPRSVRNRVGRQLRRRELVSSEDEWVARDLVRLYGDGLRWLAPMLGVFAVFMTVLAWTVGAFMRGYFVAMAAALIVLLPVVVVSRRSFVRESRPVTRAP